MLKEDYKNLISVISTLIVVIISSCIYKPIIQILFICIFILICYLLFTNLNNKKKWKQIVIGICCVFECWILIYSIASSGSISNFFYRIGDFFIREEIYAELDNNSDGNLGSSAAENEQILEIKKSIESLNGNIMEIDKSIEGINGNITEVDENIYKLANNLGNPYINNADENEVSIILQQIEKEYNNYNNEHDYNFFLNLKSDPYLLEIFYKMYISETSYYYCNIIKAFKEYGIDDEKINIDENDLLIWDIERLYATYNMKNSIINELASDEIIDEKIFMYNDFKARVNRYSDTFDYGDWRRYFTECTAKQIDNWLNTTIMNYYKKFIMNFS